MGLSSMRRYHGTHDVEERNGVQTPPTLDSGEVVVTEPEQALAGAEVPQGTPAEDEDKGTPETPPQEPKGGENDDEAETGEGESEGEPTDDLDEDSDPDEESEPEKPKTTRRRRPRVDPVPAESK